MSLERRLSNLEARVSGQQWEIPIEARVLLKAVARHHARNRREEPPPYTAEELEAMHAEDLDTVAGGGVAGQLRAGKGWESPESVELLDAWEEDARQRLERIEDGEPLEAVYNDDEDEGDEYGHE